MIRVLHVIYGIGLMGSVVAALIYPTWAAALYSKSEHEPVSAYRPQGSFGLKDGGGTTKRDWLWHPPKPHSDAIDASVRLPWQPVSQRSHVEVFVFGVVLDITSAFVVLSLLLMAPIAFAARRPPDLIAVVATSTSLALMGGGAVIGALMAFSMGYAPGNEGAAIILGAAAAIGVVLGFRGFWRQQRRRRHEAVSMPQPDCAADISREESTRSVRAN